METTMQPADTTPQQVATAPVAPSQAEPISDAELAEAGEYIRLISALFRSKVVGQENLLLSLLVAIMGNGHVLMESVPGLAKTTGAMALAEAIKGSFHRIQCTPDLLPSDIIGTQIFDNVKNEFKTQLGPVHANIVLLDEINRSSAKTQSAMLEAMQERQTTVGGVIYKLPKPFIVLATQNPIEQEGTYELPEAQMDRFLVKEILTYPTAPEEAEVLNRIESGVFGLKADESQLVNIDAVLYLQKLVQRVYIDASVKQYIVNIITATREPGKVISPELAHYVQYGSSPRGSIALMQVSKAIALIYGRNYVTPDDVKLMRHSVLRHRVIVNFEAMADNIRSEAVIDAIFEAVLAP